MLDGIKVLVERTCRGHPIQGFRQIGGEKGGDLGIRSPWIFAQRPLASLVNIVTEMNLFDDQITFFSHSPDTTNHEVHLVLPCRIPIRIEIAVGYTLLIREGKH